MIKADLHVHSNYCDGRDSLAAMAEAAYRQGLCVLGFSSHSPTDFDLSYAMRPDKAQCYREEITLLKQQYQGKMEILCGVEQDIFSGYATDDYDYVIGSVHYVQKNGEYIAVDESAEQLVEDVQRLYGGDIYALIEDYYATVAQLAAKTGADIIGHFDLISKFNEGGLLFDERHPRYQAAVDMALQSLLSGDALFEINTGAMFRNYRTVPYPAAWILRKIAAGGGKIILCGDAHNTAALCYKFEEAAALARSCGFMHHYVLTREGRKSYEL